MLHLKGIKKDYVTSSETVNALKGVTISFRDNEFVSILGPSGCGKTTLLNIIGGLDHYTDGDLVIGDRSTKSYTDRDWDVYRNHRVGFIFQSYNLIPHQTVLGNVELALTIAGVGREERIERAKRALDRVGLAGQYYKKPNQLSGGQCQRVAIARALVNDPEILLADEPTGALDTVTSTQIMDLIREISAERLVIMVTHNPEIAEKYSTRIVRLLDGEIVEDTNPTTDEEIAEEIDTLSKRAADEALEIEAAESKAEKKKILRERRRRREKAKMSFFTAFRLSLRNLISKGGRTTMVGIAGSIGIIGIAMVLAFSAGIKGYIASMQDDMLSGNPIRITETAIDFGALMGMVSSDDEEELEKLPGYAYISSIVKYFAKMKGDIQGSILNNLITEDYVNYVKAMPSEVYQAMILGYGIEVDNNIYTSFGNGEASIAHILAYYTAILSKTDIGTAANMITAIVPSFEEAPDSEEYIASQYDVYGDIATEAGEIMLVLDSDQMLTDVLLAHLGIYTEEEFLNIVYGAVENEETENPQYKPELDKDSFSFDELIGKKFKWYSNDDVYTMTETTNPFKPGEVTVNIGYNNTSEGFSGKDALELTVVGVLQPKVGISYGSLTSGVYYTKALTDYILEKSEDTDIAKHLVEKEESSGNSMFGSRATYSFDYTFGGESFTNSSAGVSVSARAVGSNPLANSVKIYPLSFEDKKLVTDYLDAWNANGPITVGDKTIERDDRADVSYTDAIELMVNMLNTLIDIVSYALIAFTSISLVVSTVMIGIITYVSVVERIKEIGVIRSLGGRKKDVSHLFNAETFIIGLLSGLIGITVTYIVSIIANIILTPLINYPYIAALPIDNAFWLIVLSVCLTLISGLIPASSAAKKDPVVALRTE